MKKSILLFIFFVFVLQLFAHSDSFIDLPTNYPFNELSCTNQRELSQPLIMPYVLGLCNSIQSLGALGMNMYIWEGTRDWVLFGEWEFTFQGDVVSEFTMTYEGMSQLYTNTIQNGRITETLVQMDMMGTLMDLEHYFYYYDGELLTSWLVQGSDFMGGWEDYEQGLYTYSNGMMTEYVMQFWEATGSVWENFDRYLVTYNGENLDEMLQQNWLNGWEDYYLSAYFYSGSQIDYVINQYWTGSYWMEDLRETYTYQGELTSNILIEEMYNESWENFENIAYNYSGSTLEEVVITEWLDSEWQNFTYNEYVYSNSAEDELPSGVDIELSNYPNPFNPSTTISFSLNNEIADNIELSIYNAKGQLIRSFPVESPLMQGQNTITWDGRDNSGSNVSSGIYFYKLEAGSTSKIKKMILLQ